MFLVVAILPIDLIAFHLVSVRRLNSVIRESNQVILLATLNGCLRLCLLRCYWGRPNLFLTLLRIALWGICLLRVILLWVALIVRVILRRGRSRIAAVISVRIIAVIVGIVSVSVIRVAVVAIVRVAAES